MRHPVAALLALTVMTSCSGKGFSLLKSEEQKKPKLVVGMNDISIMMPIRDHPDLISILPKLTDKPDPEQFAPGLPAAESDSQAFVPAWAQDQRNQHLSLKAPVNDDLKDFVMVSMRLDPCTNHLQVKNENECVPEMRLVWQKLRSEPPLGFSDSNVHTLYSLSNSEFRDILQTLSELHANASIDTLSMPLLPHPVIAKEGLSSPYLKGIIGLVHRYARSSRLNEIANMIGRNGISWSMGHVFVEKGEAKDTKIPNLPSEMKLDDVTISTGIVSFTDKEGAPALFSEHIASNDLVGKLQSSTLLEKKELPEDLKNLVGTSPSVTSTMEAFAVENPKIFNPKNTNCSTCHLTHDKKVAFGILANKDSETAGIFDIKKIAEIFGYKSSKWDLSAPFAEETSVNLQFFSISHGNFEPRIATRVVNDTADSLDLIESRGFLDLNQPVPAEAVKDDRPLAPKTEIPLARDNAILEWISSGRSSYTATDSNFGDSTFISIGKNQYSGEALLYFDLSHTPKGLVKKAELVFPTIKTGFSGSTVTPLELFLTDANWLENTVTWNNQPNKEKSIGRYTVSDGFNAIDVTQIFQEMRDAGKGLSIGVKAPEYGVTFDSKERPDGKPAYIRINF